MENKLEFLKQIAHGISSQFGSSCEVVIHDLRKKDLESSIVYIENGHVTNRNTGDGPSGVVVETMSKNPDKVNDRFSYLTRTDDGRILKSSTMYVKGDTGSIDYIFSINYDITSLLGLDTAIKSLIETQPDKGDKPEKITHNVNDLLDLLIEHSVTSIGKPVGLMTKEDKIAAIKFLNDAGAFLITKSGDKVSQFFGISKFTLYNYMDSNKDDKEYNNENSKEN